MFSALRRLPQLAGRKVLPSVRNHYDHAGPPRGSLSIVEMWAHSAAISFGILAVPVWVLVHVKEYRGLDKETAEE